MLISIAEYAIKNNKEVSSARKNVKEEHLKQQKKSAEIGLLKKQKNIQI